MSFLRNEQKPPVRIEAKLGERYRDSITGLIGVATSASLFLHGCERVGLEVMKDGELKELVFDIPRLVLLPDEVPASTTTRTGGSRPAPGRTGSGLA